MCGIRWLRQLVAELLHLRAERSPVAGANRFQRAIVMLRRALHVGLGHGGPAPRCSAEHSPTGRQAAGLLSRKVTGEVAALSVMRVLGSTDVRDSMAST